MSKTLLTVGLLGLFTVAACDQVRLPGPDDVRSTEVTEPTEPVEPAPTPDETPDPTNISTPAAEIETQPAPVDTNLETPPEETPELETEIPVEGPLAISDLAAINAVTCGLPVRPVDNSLTLAEVTGAQPADTDRVGVAVVEGDAASLADFPGLVKMEPREVLPGGAIASGHCGATRISETWFITAAHCLDDDYDEVMLIVGTETLSSPLGARVNASSSICHAAYGGAGNSYVNDIAMVRVDEADIGALADLPIASYGATQKTLVPFNYPQVRMAGWGLTAFRGSLSDRLLTATLSMTGTGPAAIGVASIEGSGPCVGDSGGPLYVAEEDGSQTVVGVLSVVEQNLETRQFCEGSYGARYTNLQGYEDWITDVIATCENGLGLCGF